MAKDLEFTAKVAADLSNPARKDEALRKLIDSWNSKNAQAGKRVGTFGFMAAALAACGGGGGGDGPGPGPEVVNTTFRFLTGTADSLTVTQLQISSLGDATQGSVGRVLGTTGLLLDVADVEDASAGLTIPEGLTYVGDISLFDSVDGEGIEVSGEGNLWILAPADRFGGNNELTVTLDIGLADGRLTFDMPSDAYRIIIDDSSRIDIGGGTLQISDGFVRVSADNFANWNVGTQIGSVEVNSSLEIDLRTTELSDAEIVDFIANFSAVTFSNESSIRFLVGTDEQGSIVRLGLLQNTGLSGSNAPAVQLLVGDPETADVVEISLSETGRFELLSDYIDGLVGRIEGGDLVANLGTLRELGLAIQRIDGDDQTEGSILKAIADAIGTTPTGWDATTGNWTTLGTGLFADVAGLITDAITYLEVEVSELDTKITGGTITATDYDTLVKISNALAKLNDAASVDGSVLNSIADAIGTAPTGWDATTGNWTTLGTGLFADVAGLIDAAITYLEVEVSELDTKITGGTITATDYDTLVKISNALEALNGTGAGSVAGVQTNLNNLITQILAGPGIELNVTEASNLAAQPLGANLIANYRVADTAGNILAATPLTVLSNAKSVSIISGADLSSLIDIANPSLDTLAEVITALSARGVDWSASSFSLTGTVTELVGLAPIVLNNAGDINVTGNVGFEQANTLMSAANAGTTTIANLVVNAGEAQAVQFDVNDVVTTLTVTGSHVDNTIDLSHFPLGTQIVFNGRAGGESVILPEGTTQGTVGTYNLSVNLASGNGNDNFVFYGGADQAPGTLSITLNDSEAASVDDVGFTIGGLAVDLLGVDFSQASDGATLAAELTKSPDIATAVYVGGVLTITAAQAGPAGKIAFSGSSALLSATVDVGAPGTPTGTGDELVVTGNIAVDRGNNTLTLVGTVDMSAVTVTSTILRFAGVQPQLTASDTITFTYNESTYTATLGADVTASGIQAAINTELGVKSGEVVASFETGAPNNLLLTVTDAEKPFVTSGLFTNVDGGGAETFGFGNVSIVALQGSASAVTISTQTVNMISGLAGDPNNPTTIEVVNPNAKNPGFVDNDVVETISLVGRLTNVESVTVGEDVVVVLDAATLANVDVLVRDGSGTVEVVGPITADVIDKLAIFYDPEGNPPSIPPGNLPTGYDLVDTAANLAALGSAVLNEAVNITATTDATVAQATTIENATNTGANTYDIEDTAANLAASSNAVLTLAGTVTSSDAATAAQADTIAAYTKAVVYSISDTASAIAGATSGALNEAVNITATGTATVANAQTIMNATNTGTTTIAAVSDDATNAATLSFAGSATNATITSLTVTGTADVTQATTIHGLISNGVTAATYSISDTASAIAGATSGALNEAVNITATTDATVAQATTIENATNTGANTYTISDTANNIANADASVLSGASSYGVSDTFSNILSGLNDTNNTSITSAGTITISGEISVFQAGQLKAAAAARSLTFDSTKFVFDVSDVAVQYNVATGNNYDALFVAANLKIDETSTSTTLVNVSSNQFNATVGPRNLDFTLIGNVENNEITGNVGNDTIIGGGESDILTGGSGNDIFVFNSAADSAASVAANTTRTFDRITDFTSVTDKLQLDAVGAIDFSATANANVRAVSVSNVADFASLEAAIEALLVGDMVASTNSLAQVYDVTLTGTGLAASGMTRLVIVNDGDTDLDADDLMIQLSGTSSASIDHTDFLFIA